MNENKKPLSIDLSDKQNRARVMLGVYVIILIVVIIIIRTMSSPVTNELANNNTNSNIVNNNTINNNTVTNEDNNSIAFVDENNYEFIVEAKLDNDTFKTEGKKYNDKFQMNYTYDNKTMKFLGTLSNIKAFDETTNTYKQSQIPFMFFNYYDNSLIRKIINNSKLVDGVYQIHSKDLATIASQKLSTSDNELNYFKVNKKNNKVVGIEMDISSAASSSMNKKVVVKVTIEYKNFGLVEDFELK